MLLHSDGHMAHAGLHGMRVCRKDTVLLTGGADGIIKRYNIMDGNLSVSSSCKRIQ